jgi:hypothetical protein
MQDSEQTTNNQYQNTPSSSRNQSSKPIVAGALLLLIGIIGVVFSSVAIGGGLIMDTLEDIPFQGYSVTSIDGTITDGSGSPLANVSIEIVGSHLSAMSNTDGYYEIKGIPSGYHEVLLEKEGYNTLIYYTYIVQGDEFDGFQQKHTQDNPLSMIESTFDFQMSQGSETYQYGSPTAPHQELFERFGGWISIIGVITMVFSIIAIIGGFFSIQRKHYVFVLISSIVAIFSFGFFIGTMLAIIALIIVIISSKEFDLLVKQTP